MRLGLALVLAMAGSAGAASMPVTGPHKIGSVSLDGVDPKTSRPVSAEVWYPSDNPGATFPLLIFCPGFGGKPTQYLSQIEEFASHGYVVAGLDPAGDSLDAFEPRTLLWAQDILFAKHLVMASPIGGLVNAIEIGAFGHSLGGRAAAAACLLDSAIRACLNEDGGNDDVQLRRPYWPISGHEFAGSFALLDWFDPGFDDEDFRSMNKTRQQYAAARLEPTRAALSAFRAVQRGSYRITILSPGMRHTAFTDDLWSNASTDAQRARYAGYLIQIRAITLAFFEDAFAAHPQNHFCNEPLSEVYTQCFTPANK